MKLAEHARAIVEELAKRRLPDGTILETSSVSLLAALGRNPSHYAMAFGQAIALIDAACMKVELPWLGRIVVFGKSSNDFVGPWSSWAPHKREILRAPLGRHWTDADVVRIIAELPSEGPQKWWAKQEQHSAALLRSVLEAARR